MKFASSFDARLFESGPPALFTLDPRGQLRVDPERTREIYLLTEPGPREPGHWVLTDEKTRLRLYLLASHPALAQLQPRGTVEQFSSYEEAISALRPHHETSQP
jgi:hypothetical protein